MNIKSLNRLIAHTPWSSAETSERQSAAALTARRSAARSKRLADIILFAAAVLIGISCLKLFKGSAGSALIPAYLIAGALLLVAGLRVQVNRQTEDWAIAQWRMEQGITPLSDRDLASLKETANARPEALQRIVAWESLGLVLRWRDRDAIEAYLRDNDVVVADREEMSIADHFDTPQGIGNG